MGRTRVVKHRPTNIGSCSLNWLKENLAHDCMDLYFLHLSSHLDISNMFNRNILEILVNLRSTEERKPKFEILSNLGFPRTPLVMSLL